MIIIVIVIISLSVPRGLAPSDPTWIGAWWLGFLLIGFATIIPSAALFFFPTGKSKSTRVTDVPDGKQSLGKRKSIKLFDRHMDKDSESQDSENLKTKEKVKSKIIIFEIFSKTDFRFCKILLRCRKVEDLYWICHWQSHGCPRLQRIHGVPSKVLGKPLRTSTIQGPTVHGYAFFFKVNTIHLTNPLTAMFGVFGFACGTATGGFVTRKFKLNGRRAALFVLVISILNVSVFFSKSFIGCHSIVNTIGKNGM